MKIIITSPQKDILEQEKLALIHKLRSLDRITRSYGSGARLEITIRKNLPQETGKIFTGEARLVIPGKDIFCRVQEYDIQVLGDKLKDKLKSLILSQRGEKRMRWRRLIRIFKRKREN